MEATIVYSFVYELYTLLIYNQHIPNNWQRHNRYTGKYKLVNYSLAVNAIAFQEMCKSVNIAAGYGFEIWW